MSAKELKKLGGFATHQIENIIMPFWRKYMPDLVNQGFYGQVNLDLSPDMTVPKGLVLNARILWSFSAIYKKYKHKTDLELATRAYEYINAYFYDMQYEGYYWSLNPDGSTHDSKKQIYAEAFVIYGLSEYYMITGKEEVLGKAKRLFQLIEKYSFDSVQNGYIEACSRDWKELSDLRLSDKDMNEKKSMNTHLHILEAYANLYRIWPDDELKLKLKNLILIFRDKIINKSDYHLDLFFDESWNSKSTVFSYGHDIEASWLIYEAATVLGDKNLIGEIENICLKVADAALKGYLNAGALKYEDDRTGHHQDHQIEWWAQAEAIVGLMNSYALTRNGEYLSKAVSIAGFIDKYVVDREHGEWYFRVNSDGSPVTKFEKAGFWKCPYHNARSCIEILNRIEELEHSS